MHRRQSGRGEVAQRTGQSSHIDWGEGGALSRLPQCSAPSVEPTQRRDPGGQGAVGSTDYYSTDGACPRRRVCVTKTEPLKLALPCYTASCLDQPCSLLPSLLFLPLFRRLFFPCMCPPAITVMAEALHQSARLPNRGLCAPRPPILQQDAPPAPRRDAAGGQCAQCCSLQCRHGTSIQPTSSLRRRRPLLACAAIASQRGTRASTTCLRHAPLARAGG